MNLKSIISMCFGVSVVLAAAVLTGCNTVHGLGQDVSSGGKALSKAAK